MVPFYKWPVATDAGLAGLLLTLLAIVGSSNAVNLTDGMDGLAIGCTLIVSFVFVVLTYLACNSKVAAYLQIPYVPGAGELTVFCAAMSGAGLGFLWYNCHPAEVFMGDTGSLALGGALGISRRAHSSALPARHRRRRLRHGSPFGHPPNRVVPALPGGATEPGGASFSWPRYITISRKRAGPNPRW